jgi:hypothetical protein
MRVIVSLIATFAVVAAVVAATASGSSGRGCPTNRTFQQAARNGSLPAIYAALHGGVPPNTSLDCFLSKH